jgi:hypothetical protein
MSTTPLSSLQCDGKKLMASISLYVSSLITPTGDTHFLVHNTIESAKNYVAEKKKLQANTCVDFTPLTTTFVTAFPCATCMNTKRNREGQSLISLSGT